MNDDNLEFQKMISKERNDFERKLKNDEIDANLKARARIEWIQEVRKRTAKLIALCYRLQNDFTPKNKLIHLVIDYSEVEDDIPLTIREIEMNEKILNSIKEKSPNLSNEEIAEIRDHTPVTMKNENPDDKRLYFEELRQSLIKNGKSREVSVLVKPKAKKYYSEGLFREKKDQLISEIKETCSILTLYFGPNPQNDKITDIINEIDEYVSSVMISEGTDIDLDEDFVEKINELSNEMRVYLKREWDRAKNNTD